MARRVGTRVFAYILKVDSGFAPNPFHGWCTLACCKPAIRRKAKPGDWILGITPRADGNRIAYAMKVKESLTFEEYWSDPRFEAKRPRCSSSASRTDTHGDNCYEPVGDGEFRQLKSRHWDHEHKREDGKQKAKDLRGKYVLVGQRFCYFGANAQAILDHIPVRLPARYNLVNFSEDEKAALIPILEALPQGIQDRPNSWPSDDGSWRKRSARCD